MKRGDIWFKDKVLLVQAQANGQILHEEELAFLADLGIIEGQATHKVITHNAPYQADYLDAYDSDYDELNTARVSLMANLSHYDPSPSCTPTRVEVPKELSKPSGNTKKDKIQQTPSSTQKNKVEAHPRTVRSSLKNNNYAVEHKGIAIVQHSKLNANSKLLCVKCNGCMLFDNHDLCILNVINNVNAHPKSKSVKKTSKRKIITTTEVPPKKPTVLETNTPKLVVTLVYSRKPRKSKTKVPDSKPKIIKSISANNKEPSKSWGSIFSDVLSFSLDECRVYYVEGLGHNLFSVGQFCNSNLKVAFHQHTCFIHNLEGVDLLTGSRGNNMYTLSLEDMMAAINHLARHSLVRGLPQLKFEKDHLCSAYAIRKRKKKPQKPKSEDTNQEKLYPLHMDLCGPMCFVSVNGKKYILVIVDDYSRFTRVKFLRSKDEALDFIIKFLNMIQLQLKAPV
nr:hypothetical protein [Tanacetum cinerariifolium]